MGNLKVKPVEFTINHKKYKVLFTVSAIYEVQEAFKMPFFEAIKQATEIGNDTGKNILTIIQILIKESAKQEVTLSELLNSLEAEEILQLMILINYIVKISCFMEKEEDEDIDFVEELTEKKETPDICERMFTIGHEFGYRDSEIWGMTPRQMFCLLRDYNKSKSGDKPKKTIDDIL